MRRKSLNILLIIITITIGGLAVRLSRRPPLVIVPELVHDENSQPIADSAAMANVPETLVTQAPEMPVVEIADRGVKDTPVQRHEDTRIADIELRTVSVGESVQGSRLQRCSAARSKKTTLFHATES